MHDETYIRLGSFFGVLVIMALWEVVSPKRSLTVSKVGRWVNNLGIIFIDNIVVYLLAPAAAVVIALKAQQNGWGFLYYFHVPKVPAVIIGVLFLDMMIYLQHLMFHAVPLLWRLHMVHHADLDIDVSTALRFHPIEILLSLIVKIAGIVVIGASVEAVLIFELLLNGTAMFNHGNVNIPEKLDRVLRLFVVTPDMHRVHHSVIIRETNSNFGFNFPWWDRIFGTYRAQPAAGHTGMTIGLTQFRNPEKLTLLHLLILPFTGDPGYYSIDKSGMEPVKIKTKR